MATPRAFASLSLTLALALALFLVVAPLCSMAGNVLYGSNSLGPGQSLASGSFKLVMQEDCNLVLYDICNIVWATNTSGRGRNCHLAFSNNGNLVLQNSNGQAVWATNQRLGPGNYAFILQEDRNLAVYGPAVWQTKTSLAGSDGLLIDSNDTVFGSALPANKTTEEAKATRISMVVNK
ncbi:alpha-D-mannose-specific plant lectins domain-containing protein [Dioscorea alata]|uniref:Alpha-D-mannose-specific plant lectins domain-containing protein n=1 Tax=Dioscorea alata TaxID=55571 RepID=A0ACB7U9T4_DIOAL|nr:alpha-D-mannose-specific plant lectins domain-containing protein [Dioscorea alata]